MVRSTLRGRAKMWKVDRPDGDLQNLLSPLRSDTFLNSPRPELNPEANTRSKVSTEGQPQISHIIREISKGKLEVGIINRSILVNFLMRFRMDSNMFLCIVLVFLDVVRAILHNFELNLSNSNRDRALQKIPQKSAQ